MSSLSLLSTWWETSKRPTARPKNWRDKQPRIEIYNLIILKEWRGPQNDVFLFQPLESAESTEAAQI